MSDSGPSVTGLILAGGHSTRFGPTDKAFAKLGGKPILRHVAEGVAPVVEELIISCRQEQVRNIRTVLSEIEVPYTIAVDTEKVGPVGGIRDGLSEARFESAFVVGCDFPRVNERLLSALDLSNGIDAVIPQTADGQLQPLCGRYRTGPTRTAAQRLLENGDRRVKKLAERLDVKVVDIQRLGFDANRLLVDINTQADLRAIEAELFK